MSCTPQTSVRGRGEIIRTPHGVRGGGRGWRYLGHRAVKCGQFGARANLSFRPYTGRERALARLKPSNA